MPKRHESSFAFIIERACDWLLYVATAAGALLTAFVALSAFMRYLLGKPFGFTEELVGLLFSAMVYLSLPYCTVRRRHIEVTLITDRLPPPMRRIMGVVSALLVLVFCGWYGAFAWDFVEVSWRLHSRSDIGGMALWPWMATMLVTCVFMALAIVALWRRHRLEQGQGATGV
jgi:TRAP-type C4-dicarboxylate transport system permease small subunit